MMKNVVDSKIPTGDIFARLRWGIDNLSNRQSKACSYLRDNYTEVAFWSVEDFSRNSGVSPATVIRTATSLGYNGYRDMIMEFKSLLVNKNVSLWWKIEQSVADTKKEATPVWVTRDNVESLKSGLTPLLLENYKSAVEMLSKAGKIYIVAVRSSRPAAIYMHSMLSQFLDNTAVITYGEEDIYEDLIDFTTRDVVITISLGGPHFARAPINVIKFAKESKIKTLLITTDPTCPGSEYATLVLCVGQAKEHYSLIPTLTLMESMIIDLVKIKTKQAHIKLKKLEKILQEQGITY